MGGTGPDLQLGGVAPISSTMYSGSHCTMSLRLLARSNRLSRALASASAAGSALDVGSRAAFLFRPLNSAGMVRKGPVPGPPRVDLQPLGSDARVLAPGIRREGVFSVQLGPAPSPPPAGFLCSRPLLASPFAERSRPLPEPWARRCNWLQGSPGPAPSSFPDIRWPACTLYFLPSSVRCVPDKGVLCVGWCVCV